MFSVISSILELVALLVLYFWAYNLDQRLTYLTDVARALLKCTEVLAGDLEKFREETSRTE